MNCTVLKALRPNRFEITMPKWKLAAYPMKLLYRTLFFVAAFQGGARWLHSQTPLPTEINLVVMEGEGQSTDIGQQTHRPPLVRVEKMIITFQIANAAVTFTLPTEGATGKFGNGLKDSYRYDR